MSSADKKGIFEILIALFCVFCVAVCQFKVSSSTVLLMQNFGINNMEVGLLTSATSIAGLILAIPVGALIAKFGFKLIGLIALFACAIGSCLGFFTNSYKVLLFSRILEGIAVGSIFTVVPSLIAVVAKGKSRTFFMSVFSCYVGVGQIIVFITTNLIVDQSDPESYKNLWLLTNILLLICIVLWLVFIKPSQSESVGTDTSITIRGLYKYASLWIIALLMFFYISIYKGITTYTMPYINSIGLDLIFSNNLSAIRAFVGIVTSIITGLIIASFSKRKHYIAGIIACILNFFAIFSVWSYTTEKMAIVSLVIVGITDAASLAIFTSLSPYLLKDLKLVGITNGFITIGKNLAILSVPFISGSTIDSFGFGPLTFVYFIFGIASLILSILLYFVNAKSCAT
ncbi:MAG: MFS transporter [Sphaerochaetaceae bacterium]|nr:MFS transporter [Sphaerochaetaceae bacterium]